MIVAGRVASCVAASGVVAFRSSATAAITANSRLLPLVIVVAVGLGYIGLRMGRRARPSGFRVPERFAREATGQDGSVLEVILRENAESDDVAAIRDAIAASPQIRIYTFVAPDSFLALVHAPEQVTTVARRLARLPGVERAGPRETPSA